MDHLFTDFFPFGAQYHRAPTPLECEWDGDLAEIIAKGYTHIQFRPQWRCHERIRGEYDFAELDRLFAVAQKHGVRVIVKPQLETAPDWVFTELDGARVGFGGQPLPPIAHAAFYVGGWWPCFDNPAVAEAAGRFTEALATHVKDQPNLWFFNAWNEPRSRPMGQCQCPHSIRSYRDYLRRRFGTIEALNAAFGKAWTSFETVFPPQSHSDYAELYLWRQWAGEAVAAQVRISAEAIRRGAPGKPVMCHVGFTSITQDPACDTSNDLLNAKQVDFYGCSLGINLLPHNRIERLETPVIGAWMRRVDPNFWCQEFYTNFANWCQEAEPEFVEQALWMILAAGAGGLTFWQWRSERFGEETNGWGMREMDGTPTPRSERCDRVADELKTWGAELAHTAPPTAEAAILFDPANDLLMRIEAMEGPLNGIANIQSRTDYSYKCGIRGAFYSLLNTGNAPDFITPEDGYGNYKLLIVNCLEQISDATARALEAFVENGGVLLVEYPFACRDERTWATLQRPSLGLDRLVGCREIHRLALPDGQTRALRYANGAQDAASFCQVALRPTTGTVLATWEDGAPAAVENAYGQGKVFTCGGNLSIAVRDAVVANREPALPCLYALALQAAGLSAETTPFWTLERTSRENAFRFLFNPTEKPQDVEIPSGFQMRYASAEAKAEGNRLALAPNAAAVLQKSL